MELNKNLVNKIKSELKKFNMPKSKKKIFYELCFCVLVANNNLERTLNIWNKLKNCFLNCDKKLLSKKLKQAGYRFYNKRAEYIVYNKKFFNILPEKIKRLNEYELRDWLVKNLKGIGYKEASHFLRNLGFKDFAILDRHILRFLYKNKIIKEIPKNLSKKIYLEIEDKFKKFAKKLNLNPAELDFYIFYLEKGCFPLK